MRLQCLLTFLFTYYNYVYVYRCDGGDGGGIQNQTPFTKFRVIEWPDLRDAAAAAICHSLAPLFRVLSNVLLLEMNGVFIGWKTPGNVVF